VAIKKKRCLHNKLFLEGFPYGSCKFGRSCGFSIVLYGKLCAGEVAISAFGFRTLIAADDVHEGSIIISSPVVNR
jgi:hypothetical protein